MLYSKNNNKTAKVQKLTLGEQESKSVFQYFGIQESERCHVEINKHGEIIAIKRTREPGSSISTDKEILLGYMPCRLEIFESSSAPHGSWYDFKNIILDGVYVSYTHESGSNYWMKVHNLKEELAWMEPILRVMAREFIDQLDN